MRVFKSIEDISAIIKPVITIGTFDGLHFGHQKIIEQVKKRAHEIKGESVVVTFHPHPRLVLFPNDTSLKLLFTLDEKISYFRETGIDNLIIYPFTKEFANLTSIEFVRDILVAKIGLQKLIIGHDHHFGKNREGSFEKLQELAPLYNFEVEEIPVQDIEQVSVSSTKIRNALLAGDVVTAEKYLSKPYSISAMVVKGNQIGRDIGYPTANLYIDVNKLIPNDGAYAVYVYVNSQKHKGMLNIGMRPTIAGNKRTVEVNIFDFNTDIYNTIIKVEFIKKIRNEKKFKELNLLKLQLATDKMETLKILE